jgi:hypothetical protein
MQYEIIEKVTELCFDAVAFESDTTNPQDDFVLVRREDTGEVIRFENDNVSGELTNDLYIIRQKDTHVKADGTGEVEITEAGITDTEGIVAPTEIVADEVAVETPVEEVIATTPTE